MHDDTLVVIVYELAISFRQIISFFVVFFTDIVWTAIEHTKSKNFDKSAISTCRLSPIIMLIGLVILSSWHHLHTISVFYCRLYGGNL